MTENTGGRTWPIPTRIQATQAFQRFWVAGTLGAFFAALARNLPVHLGQISLTPNWLYTFDLWLRYGYLLWLITYFFVSNLHNDLPDAQPNWRDVVFDVTQSIVSLAAAFCMGFVLADHSDELGAYAAAHVAVFVIASMAYVLFHTILPQPNKIRLVAAGVSLLVLAYICWWRYARDSIALDCAALVIFAAALLVDWVILGRYIHLRLTKS